jgi:Spy/CpxP family protein refolding chaperone
MEKKNNLFKIGLIVLIILNVILLSKMYFFDHRPHHPKNHEHTDEFVINELKLTEEQTQQYQKLIEQHRDSIKNLADEGRELRELYFSQLKSNVVNQQLKNEVLIKISANQQKIEEITFYHFMSLKQILQPEQKIRFDQIIDEVLIRLAHQSNLPHN